MPGSCGLPFQLNKVIISAATQDYYSQRGSQLGKSCMRLLAFITGTAQLVDGALQCQENMASSVMMM